MPKRATISALQGRIGLPRTIGAWLTLVGGGAFVGAGFFAGYLVGWVAIEDATSAAVTPSVWPTIEAKASISGQPVEFRGLAMPKADRMVLATWQSRHPKWFPAADSAGSLLPTAIPRRQMVAEASAAGITASAEPVTDPPSAGAPTAKLPIANLQPGDAIPAPPRADLSATSTAERDEALAKLPLVDVPLPDRSDRAPRIAIVIDDLGLNRTATKNMIALDPGLTLAFLPYGERSGALAAEARIAGHEVLLHMPMEPNSRANPGPDALLTLQEPKLIRTRLRRALDRIPQAIGLNNHMGSRFTSNAAGMEVVLDELNARGMMILDSVTSPKSVIPKLARERGMPSDARDVFLDNIRDVALIHQQLDELERIARAVGSAVAVGHPYSETAIALREWLPGARERGIDLVPISRLATPSLDHPMVAANHLRQTGTDLR